MSEIPDDQVPGWPTAPGALRRPDPRPYDPWPQQPTPQVVHVVVEQPTRRRRPGLVWWLLVGWWWRPACWSGRVLLWLVAWPLGLWRSIRHGQRHPRR